MLLELIKSTAQAKNPDQNLKITVKMSRLIELMRKSGTVFNYELLRKLAQDPIIGSKIADMNKNQLVLNSDFESSELPEIEPGLNSDKTSNFAGEEPPLETPGAETNYNATQDLNMNNMEPENKDSAMLNKMAKRALKRKF